MSFCLNAAKSTDAFSLERRETGAICSEGSMVLESQSELDSFLSLIVAAVCLSSRYCIVEEFLAVLFVVSILCY